MKSENNLSENQKKLFGALAGLVHACENNPPLPTTTAIIIEGICTAGPVGSDTENETGDLIERIHEEKNRIVPNCQKCLCPCGNTSDYDMDLVDKKTEEEKKAIYRLINRLFRIASNPEISKKKDMEFALYQGIAVLSMDWSAEEMDRIGEIPE